MRLQKIFETIAVLLVPTLKPNLRQRQITGSKTNEDLPCVCDCSDMYKNIAIDTYGQLFNFSYIILN